MEFQLIDEEIKRSLCGRLHDAQFFYLGRTSTIHFSRNLGIENLRTADLLRSSLSSVTLSREQYILLDPGVHSMSTRHPGCRLHVGGQVAPDLLLPRGFPKQDTSCMIPPMANVMNYPMNYPIVFLFFHGDQ